MNNTISVTEVRKRLPQLLRDIQRQPDKVFKVTVHNEVVAEIKAPSMIAEPGQAAKKLLAFRKRHPHVPKTRPVEAVSENIKTFLYGDNNKS
jgi:antitoxin (DNA-binding transcriptional repressor) of toxin-antitoxin stability system